MKFDSIVHPTDFSETSLNAFSFACEIARKNNSKFHLVHVYERSYYQVAGSGGGLTYQVDSAAENSLRSEILVQLKHLTERPEARDIKFFSKLIADIPAWRFYEEIPEERVDLIIMGTRGVTGLLHGGLVGTNTERVIRHSSIPVLSVPEGATFNGIKYILFATDFQDNLDTVYPHVLDVAKMFGAKLFVGVINTRNNFATSRHAYEQFEALTAKYPYNNVELVVHNDDSVEEGIQGLSHRLKIDLIAMLTHGRTGIAHLLRGSIAEDISSSLSTPLLTLKA
ncbi:MAG: universal stress protein [Bacteroidetes bacterium]|nr:universal stress protein [Bacteroidota bacterium]